MSNKKQKGRRNRLFACHPYCHWCGVLLSHPTEYQHGGKDGVSRIKNIKYHMATLDHLDSRYSNERGSHAWEIRTVLACYECNGYRNDVEQAKIALKELHKRAHRISWIHDIQDGLHMAIETLQ